MKHVHLSLSKYQDGTGCPALRSGYGGLKIFCGQPTLPTHPVPSYIVTKTNIYHIYIYMYISTIIIFQVFILNYKEIHSPMSLFLKKLIKYLKNLPTITSEMKQYYKNTI